MRERERDEEEVRILITAKQQEDEKVEFLYSDLFLNIFLVWLACFGCLYYFRFSAIK
jgi:hypothetical protein